MLGCYTLISFFGQHVNISQILTMSVFIFQIIEHIKGSYDEDTGGRSIKPSLNGSINGSILSGTR